MVRVSKVSALARKLKRQREQKFRYRLRPPFDCVMCEGFGTVEVTKSDPFIVFHCKDCDSREIMPLSDEIELIDYFNIVADKWLSLRFGEEFEEPEFEIELIRGKDEEEKWQVVTLGKLKVVWKDPPKGRRGGGNVARVPWGRVIEDIIQDGRYFTVKEVREMFCEDKVKDFRVKTMLDKAWKDGKLMRLWFGNCWVFGRVAEVKE